MNFYNIIKELMYDKGVDLKTLSEGANIDLSTLYYYSKNKKSPDLNILIKLSNYFQCSIDYLLGLTDNNYYSKNKSKYSFVQIYENLLKKNNTNNFAVSKIIGFSRSRYYDWKKGVMPQISTLKDLAKYFNVSIDYLIGRSDDE